MEASSPPTALGNRPETRGPVWVLISTLVPVEIFEGGRRVGTSWGGGIRLSPGTHDLHIVNRANAVDSQQSVEIVAGTAMTLVWSLWKADSASRRGIGTDGPELLV